MLTAKFRENWTTQKFSVLQYFVDKVPQVYNAYVEKGR